ncbi:MAG: hypothetical protein HQL82_04480 [Magnetococcales bacterium]|nr:hypothetical protein [Magnetococcales bacterium]
MPQHGRMWAAALLAAAVMIHYPGEARAACDTAACFNEKADQYEVEARRKQSALAVKQQEFRSWENFEKVRIEVMDETIKIYRQVAKAWGGCTNKAGRSFLEEAISQLGKINLSRQDDVRISQSRQYVENAKGYVKRGQEACGG